MRFRLYFLLVTVFFVTMNVLLWRSNFGSPVPVETVLEKILTAPDNSRLEIRHRGVKVGNCRWSPTVGDGRAADKRLGDEPAEEGMIDSISGYTLELDGTTALDHLSRVRFGLLLKLSTNHAWQEFALHLSMRPAFAWELRSLAAEQTVKFRTESDEGTRERAFTFADLRHPDKLLREFGDSFFPAAGLTALALPWGPGKSSPLTPGLKWEAHNDWLKFGRDRMRVYRLQTRLFEGWQVRIYVSPVGEILRVELPDDIRLVHEDLPSP